MKQLGMIAPILAMSALGERVPGSTLIANASDDDLEVGTLEIGAYYPQPRMFRGPNRARTVPRRSLIPMDPGVPDRGVKLQPLGLSAIAFTATSGTALQMTASPQRPFKAKRMILDFTRTGASATGLLTVTSIAIGTANQLVGTGPLPASAFSVTAFDANIEFAPATPGIQVNVGVSISAAPTMTDVVNVAGALFGSALG